MAVQSAIVGVPAPERREELFRAFARALFRRDIDALYEVVTTDFAWRYDDGAGVPVELEGPEAIGTHLEAQRERFSQQRFRDVEYHHLAEVSFMTFRVDEVFRASGESRSQEGIERYRFRDGRIALKDVYRKPLPPGRFRKLQL